MCAATGASPARRDMSRIFSARPPVFPPVCVCDHHSPRLFLGGCGPSAGCDMRACRGRTRDSAPGRLWLVRWHATPRTTTWRGVTADEVGVVEGLEGTRKGAKKKREGVKNKKKMEKGRNNRQAQGAYAPAPQYSAPWIGARETRRVGD